MRILHADSGREMRGGQWQVLRLHSALVEAGHDSLLLAREGGALRALAVERGLPCQSLSPLRVRSLSESRDLLHAHDARAHTMGAIFSRAPLVVSRRVAFPVGTSFPSRRKYGSARRFLAVSHYVAARLEEAGVSPASIDVVYDGVELPSAPANGNEILTPYTLDPAKGMALAEQAAKLAGLPIFCSRDLEHDLTRARALVYLTQSEGLGSGILLAMAYGVTVIASRTGGILELIEDGITGILVPNEAEAVAAAMRNIDPALGIAAREVVRARFTVQHMLQATLASYEKALA